MYIRRIALTLAQVIHPFYVFQIASIILWSLDNYYYYAFCIALISALSITTTLLETKKVAAVNDPAADNINCLRPLLECEKCQNSLARSRSLLKGNVCAVLCYLPHYS